MYDDKQTKFPLLFKVIKSHLSKEQIETRKRMTKFTNDHTDHNLITHMFDKKWNSKLQNVEVCMSTKNRLPTKDNCEVYVRGVDKLFTFGVVK